MSLILLATNPYLTLYIKVARYCKCLFCRLGRLARLRRLEYSSGCVSFIILTMYSFPIWWQYVKYGNIEDLYESNFASVRNRFLNLERAPALWLAFLQSSLMCYLNARCSSINFEKANVPSAFYDMRIQC